MTRLIYSIFFLFVFTTSTHALSPKRQAKATFPDSLLFYEANKEAIQEHPLLKKLLEQNDYIHCIEPLNRAINATK